MNSVGIGTVVGLGSIIGLGIVARGSDLTEYLTTFAFYGFFAGFLYELYSIALRGISSSFRRR